MKIEAEHLLDEAIMDGIILEDEIESLKDKRGNFILDEIVGLINDRDCEWLDNYMDEMNMCNLELYGWDSRAAWCEEDNMEYEPITFLGEEDY